MREGKDGNEKKKKRKNRARWKPEKEMLCLREAGEH